MNITPEQKQTLRNATIEQVGDALEYAIRDSRFTAGVIQQERNLKLETIRLRKAKPYCGNHPNACILSGSHRKGKWLEGADWVEFNDLVNDVLDSINACANVRTSVCWVRKAAKRRLRYSSQWIHGFWHWLKDEPCYADYRLRIAPRSIFPVGTPGICNQRSVNHLL